MFEAMQETRPVLDGDARRSCTLHVCTSCRPRGTPREPERSRPGFILYEALRNSISDSPLQHVVDVRPTPCLSICPRPCGIALSLPGAWTYLFGDQNPGETTRDVMECIALYLDSPDGFMERAKRPKSMRGSILGRVPPIEKGGQCT